MLGGSLAWIMGLGERQPFLCLPLTNPLRLHSIRRLLKQRRGEASTACGDESMADFQRKGSASSGTNFSNATNIDWAQSFHPLSLENWPEFLRPSRPATGQNRSAARSGENCHLHHGQPLDPRHADGGPPPSLLYHRAFLPNTCVLSSRPSMSELKPRFAILSTGRNVPAPSWTCWGCPHIS